MKVTVAHGGTIVPVLVTSEADTASLLPEHAERLRQLVHGLGSLEQVDGASAAQPDRGSYRVSIDSGGAVRSAIVSEVDASASLRALVDFVSTVPGATKQTTPLGRDRAG